MKILTLRMPAPALFLMIPFLLLACGLFGSEEESAVPEVAPTEQATETSEPEPTAEPTATPEEPTPTSEPSPTPEEPTATATTEPEPQATTAVDPAPTIATVPTISLEEYPGLSTAADVLGVSEADLLQAINQPSTNLATVAEALGVDELALRIALEAAGVPIPQ